MAKKGKEDTYSYKGWIVSDNFLKRCFAIYGHSFVAGLLVSIPFMFFYFIMVMMFLIAVNK